MTIHARHRAGLFFALLGTSAIGRGCVKTQIQKFKVGNQNHFTDIWSSLWGTSVSQSDIPCS